MVIDASAVFDALTAPQPPDRLKLALERDELHAPGLIDYEVGAALRGRLRGGYLDEAETAAALGRYQRVTIHRHDGVTLLPAILAMRHNFTAYDAAYLALAQVLDAPLVTADSKLLEARRLGVNVQVFS